VGVYFSPKTRDYYPKEFIASYRGILILLMQAHVEFQVVTPRALAAFAGKTLILPNVRVVSDEEQYTLRKYVAGANTVVITGEDATNIRDGQNIIRFSKDPGAEYYSKLQNDFDSAIPTDEKQFVDSLRLRQKIHIVAPSSIATSIASVDGKPHVFLANFAGLRGGVNSAQTPATGIQVTVDKSKKGNGFFLPFLGEVSLLHGVVDHGAIKFSLPVFQKGAVFWWEP